MSLQVRRLSHTVGAEIIGVDLREPVDAQDFNEIYAAFLEYGVLLFRDQLLKRAQLVAFSRRFGEVDQNDATPRDRDPECPEVKYLTNKPKTDGQPSNISYAGDFWHTDQSFTPQPAKATLLRSVEIPDVGGDTMFTNMHLAYDTLSDGMKKLLAELHCVHIGVRRIENTPSRAADVKKANPPIAQPLVRVHPETGRKALYLTEKVEQFAGMTKAESRPLLDFLLQHATRPQFIYRHRWCKDDLLMWDNRRLMHIAVGDYDGRQIRHMERTTVMGTPSGYVYEGALQ